MPSPKSGESRRDFMKRCIPYVMGEGAANTSHAAAKCHGIFDQWIKRRKQKGRLVRKR